jgi:hypothetical protein
MVGQLDEILPGKETFRRAQSSLADLLERQPLVLGAVGLAVGAALRERSELPTSRTSGWASTATVSRKT